MEREYVFNRYIFIFHKTSMISWVSTETCICIVYGVKKKKRKMCRWKSFLRMYRRNAKKDWDGCKKIRNLFLKWYLRERSSKGGCKKNIKKHIFYEMMFTGMVKLWCLEKNKKLFFNVIMFTGTVKLKWLHKNKKLVFFMKFCLRERSS